MPPNKLSFSSQLPNHQFAWDSTSLGELKTCPRKYYYSIILGYAERRSNVHLTFGILNHKAHEKFDKLKAQGASYQQAVNETLSYTLNETFDPELGRPWDSDDPNKNRGTLIRSILWYFDKFQNDKLETLILKNGKPAVELSFRISLGFNSNLTGDEYLLCGHLDRLVSWEQKSWILDYKTTRFTMNAQYFERFNPDNQMSAYSVAGTHILHEPIAGVIIDACQVAVNFVRFQRGFTYRSPEQLEEWLNDAAYYIRLAEHYVENDHWPQNDKACGVPTVDSVTGEFRYGCQFREVCGSHPLIRQQLLESNFAKRIWDPLVTREA